MLSMLCALCGCGAPQPVHREHFAMGTVAGITVYNTRHAQYIDECFTLLNELEAEVSINVPESTISRLNEAGSAQLGGETDAAKILLAADRVYTESGGAFNAGILPLQQLWDIGGRSDGDPLPADDDIEQARQLSLGGFDIGQSGDTVSIKLGEGHGLDLGGIAKGYAGDRCADLLKERGVKHALINIGGNVRTVGGREFRIGLRNPRGTADELYAVVTVGETNVITSGDYERYFTTGGERYHHIFDPDTGRPARSGLLSATVIGGDGAIADGLSTAIFVLGRDEGLALAEGMGYEAVVVADDYKVYCTGGIADALEITDDKFELVSP